MRLVPIIRYCPREWISTLTSQANLIGPQISLEAYHSGKIKRDNSSTRFLATGRTSPPRRLRAHIRGASASAAQDLPKQPLLPRLYKYRALASRRGPRPFSPSKHSDHSSIQSPRSTARLPISTGILPLVAGDSPQEHRQAAEIALTGTHRSASTRQLRQAARREGPAIKFRQQAPNKKR